MATQQAELQNRLVAVQMLSERREALAEQVGFLQQLCIKAQVGRGLPAWRQALGCLGVRCLC